MESCCCSREDEGKPDVGRSHEVCGFPAIALIPDGDISAALFDQRVKILGDEEKKQERRCTLQHR